MIDLANTYIQIPRPNDEQFIKTLTKALLDLGYTWLSDCDDYRDLSEKHFLLLHADKSMTLDNHPANTYRQVIFNPDIRLFSYANAPSLAQLKDPYAVLQFLLVDNRNPLPDDLVELGQKALDQLKNEFK